MTDDLKPEVTLNSLQAFQGRIFNVRVDTVALGRGGQSIREIVEHRPCVCIVPYEDEQNIIMVRQYRKAVEEVLLEIPAGNVEEGELSEETVLRELQEETGYSASQLELLSRFWISPGFSTELMHSYVATGLFPSSLPADEDEDIRVEHVSMTEVPGLIRKGIIKDAKSIASLMMAMHLRGSH
jgi:ADP-ribose pyrophosphatase